MRTQVLVIAAAALAAFVLGRASPPPSDPPVAAVAALRIKSPTMVRPGPEAASAAQYLAALNPPPPPPAKPRPPKPPPPPAPPDVAIAFRNAITAIVKDRSDEELGIVLRGGSPGQRVLHAGDAYADGWRVAEVNRREIVLKRGREQRTIAFFAAPGGS